MGSITGSFEKTLKQSTARGANIVPGCILAAANKSGKLIYENSAGYQTADPDASPIDPKGVLWIASFTKLLTSVCALQCVENGLIDLDEDVGRVLPELAAPSIVTADPSAPGGLKTTKATKPITLRQLLTHTSGLGYEFISVLLQAWRKTQKGPGKGFEQKYCTPLLFEPGQSWEYGVGVDWAGRMVEKLHGDTTLGEYMSKKIFEPLGMTSTTFHVDQRPDLLERIVPATRRKSDGTLVPHEGPIWAHTATEESGGGGLWSTVPDYTKVLVDLLQDEPTLLKKETVDNMLCAPQLSRDSPSLESLVRARSVTQGNAAAADSGINYGLGGMVLTKDSEVLPARSLTWGGYPNLKWFLNRDLGVAAIYASQLVPPSDPHVLTLSSEFFREVVRMIKES